jgi:hypothetical protein
MVQFWNSRKLKAILPPQKIDLKEKFQKIGQPERSGKISGKKILNYDYYK